MMGCDYGVGGMSPWMMIIPGIISLAVLALLIFGAVWLVRYYTHTTRPAGDPAEQELRRRYATGEITHEEYQQRLTNLRG